MTTTVIEIQAKVSDQTGSGTSSVVKNLSKIEQAGLSMQKTLANAGSMSKLEFTASLKDSASAGLSGIMSLGKSIAGKTWSVTSKLLDYATAPIRGILDLVKNPIVQTVTLMGITAGVTSIVSTYADYEQSLADTKAVTGASDEEIASIGTVVKDLGATTTFSAAEVGAGASVLGTAGWTAEQITGGLGGIVTMAQAGGVDIATAADINTSTIAQYGLQSTDSGYVGDVLASTAASSKTDISGLGETFKYVGSTASALEFSLEDTAIAVGLLGNAAIDGSQAGTSLRTLFTNLVDPSSDAAEAMSVLGVSLTDSEGGMNSLMDIMLQLRTGFSTLSAEEQAFYAASLAGTEGLSGLLAIANAGETDFEKLTEAIYGAEGAAQEMADTRVDSLQGDFAALSSAVDGVKISIGERLAPTLRSFVQMATDYVPQIGEAIDAVLADSQMRFSLLVDTPEWEGASLGEKITLTWDAMVGDPFGEWWEDTGRESVTSMANSAGETLGSVLSGGLMTLLGIDIGDSASEGMKVGKAFIEGFMDGFDLSGVAEGLWNTLGSVASEAGKIFSGEGTAASWLSALGLTVGTSKIVSGVASGVGSVVGAVKGGASAVSAVAGAAGGLASTGIGSLVTSSVTSLFKSGGVVSLMYDTLLGSSKSEEWVGGDSLTDKIASAVGGALGGTNSGFSGAVTGAAKGAAVGSFLGPIGTGVGAVAGGVLGAFGGETIASTLTGNNSAQEPTIAEISTEISTASGNSILPWMNEIEENLSEIDSKVSEVSIEMDTVLQESTEKASEAISNSITEIVEESIPEYMETLCDGTDEMLNESISEAQEIIDEDLSGFFGETLPEFLDSLWMTTEESMTNELTTAIPLINQGISKFFGTTVPNSFQSIWNSASSALSKYSDLASASISSSASNFFSTAQTSIANFFQSASGSMSYISSEGTATLTSVSAHAEGGILSTPHLGLVAEDGPEAIIPLGEKRRSRGIALWEEAGRQLGISAYAEGGIVGKIVPPISSGGTGGGGVVVPVTIGNINFHITVPENVKSESDLLAIIKSNIADLSDEIAEQLAKKLGDSFANMPILT